MESINPSLKQESDPPLRFVQASHLAHLEVQEFAELDQTSPGKTYQKRHQGARL